MHTASVFHPECTRNFKFAVWPAFVWNRDSRISAQGQQRTVNVAQHSIANAVCSFRILDCPCGSTSWGLRGLQLYPVYIIRNKVESCLNLTHSTILEEDLNISDRCSLEPPGSRRKFSTNVESFVWQPKSDTGSDTAIAVVAWQSILLKKHHVLLLNQSCFKDYKLWTTLLFELDPL